MLITLSGDPAVPVYRQIVDAVKAQLFAGALEPGDELPPVRDLAGMLAVHMHTVRHAYRELAGEGLIVMRLGRRTRVATRPVDGDGREARAAATLDAGLARLWNKWGFLPSAALVLATLAMAAAAQGTGLERWPFHFDAAGNVNRWGGPEEFYFLVGLQVMMMAMMFCLDEMMVRLGRWNLASAFAGFMTASFAYAVFITWRTGVAGTGRDEYGLWPAGFALCAAAAAASWGLDRLRASPPPPPPNRRTPLPAPEAEDWCYWERVRSPWLDSLLGLSVLLTAGVGALVAYTSPREEPAVWWIVGGCAALAVVELAFLGGFTITATPDRVRLAWGLARVPWMTVRMADVAGVEAVAVNPLRDFGGYGVRYGRGRQWGFITGNGGVRLRTRQGRTIVFSTDNPEGVAALLARRVREPGPGGAGTPV